MTTIKASGTTIYGKISVKIVGNKMVSGIQASDPTIKQLFKRGIHRGDGWMANGFYPEPDTMLQAYAYCLRMFAPEDITVDGDIGEIESKPGVIY